jgi:hypothetical protein
MMIYIGFSFSRRALAADAGTAGAGGRGKALWKNGALLVE